jgi:hypothetical protein
MEGKVGGAGKEAKQKERNPVITIKGASTMDN